MLIFFQGIIYWPPERFRLDKLKYDERADIWSLGITLLECMIDELPYLENGRLTSGIEPLVFAQYAITMLKEDDYKKYLGYKRNSTDTSNTIYNDFIEMCLKEIDQRATLIELKNSQLYQYFVNKEPEKINKRIYTV